MIDKTEMEKRAIEAARYPVYEALSELGMLRVFDHFSSDADRQAAIDRLTEAAWDGCRHAMEQQVAQRQPPAARPGVPMTAPFNDEIPF